MFLTLKPDWSEEQYWVQPHYQLCPRRTIFHYKIKALKNMECYSRTKLCAVLWNKIVIFRGHEKTTLLMKADFLDGHWFLGKKQQMINYTYIIWSLTMADEYSVNFFQSRLTVDALYLHDTPTLWHAHFAEMPSCTTSAHLGLRLGLGFGLGIYGSTSTC